MVTLSSQRLFRSKGEELLMGEKVSGEASFHITQPTKWERESGDGGQREEAERRYHSALPPSAQHYANASKGGMETVRHLPNKENCVMGLERTILMGNTGILFVAIMTTFSVA